jgi:hypothetical protein
VIDGQLAQGVMGIGGYALWNNLLYVEATGYRTAPQGALQADSTAVNAIHGIARTGARRCRISSAPPTACSARMA